MRDDDRQHVLREAVAAAVRAPSSHNTQPWRFEIAGDRLLLFADYRRHLSTIDHEGRQLLMSCGCALFNARIAVHAWGYADIVTLEIVDTEHPDLVATIELGDRIVTPDTDLSLLRAIGKRATYRGAFLSTPVSADLAGDLAETAALHGTQMVRLHPTDKSRIGELVDHADQLQLSDPAVRRELAHWLTPFGSRRHDGIRFADKEYGSKLPFTLQHTLRSAELGERFGHLEQQLINDAPLVVVLGTDSDDPLEWLRCGQALEAVLLHATHCGLSAAFDNQVLEIPESRGEIAQLTGLAYPQMILRLGHPAEESAHRTPRRDVAEVLR